MKFRWVRVAAGGGGTLRRQNAAQAGSAGAGNYAGTSGEVAAGLAGRLGAIFCAASYHGPVWRILHVKIYDVTQSTMGLSGS